MSCCAWIRRRSWSSIAPRRSRCATARALRKAPLFTTLAVASLGLGLGLNTTIFALGDAVLHPYLPYPHPERIAIPSFRGGDPKHWLQWQDRFGAIRDGMQSYDLIA